MPKVTINGNTFEASTQEELERAVEIFGKGTAAAAPPASKPSTKKARPTLNRTQNNNQPTEIKPLTLEEFKEGIKTNPSATILQLLNEALGFDIKTQLSSVAMAASHAYRDSATTAATLALQEQGLVANEKNIKEFLESAQAEMGNNFRTSLDAFRPIAEAAKENEWFEAAPTADTTSTSTTEKASKKEDEAKEQKLDAASRNIIEENLSEVPDGNLSEADVKKMEKALTEMSEEEFNGLFASAD